MRRGGGAKRVWVWEQESNMLPDCSSLISCLFPVFESLLSCCLNLNSTGLTLSSCLVQVSVECTFKGAPN